MRAGIAVAVLLALAAPASAFAHATLLRTVPANGAVLARAPVELRVVFDDVVHVGPDIEAVRNAGGSNALHVLLNDLLSPQSTFLSATTSQGSCVTPAIGASGTMSCSLGTIASGASSTINFKVNVLAKKGTITNSVTVSTTTVDTNSANNAASITTRVK